MKENALAISSGKGGFFRDFGTAVARGDLFVKLSLIWWGAGYVRRRQYWKAVIMTALEALVIWFTVAFALQYVPKFGSLGTVQAEQVFNMETMKTEWNDYDDSFQILLFSVLSFVVWFTAIVVLMKNTVNVYHLQLRAEQGLHIKTFKEDLNSYLNEKFHITLLSLPVLGVVLFNVIPLLILILVAFTNYDQQHMPPTALFTWTGLTNFINLFGGGGLTVTFAQLEDLSFTLAFVDGNHENFDLLAEYPVEEWNGGKVQFIRPHVIHLMRGQVYTLEGYTFFTMGGASSHDIEDGVLDPRSPDYAMALLEMSARGCRFRINHKSWWKEELPSAEEYAEARRNLNAHGWAVDYIITHSPPSGLLPALGGYQSDQLTDFLEEIRQQAKYHYWLFGHCHQNKAIDKKHILLWEDIVQVM